MSIRSKNIILKQERNSTQCNYAILACATLYGWVIDILFCGNDINGNVKIVSIQRCPFLTNKSHRHIVSCELYKPKHWFKTVNTQPCPSSSTKWKQLSRLSFYCHFILLILAWLQMRMCAFRQPCSVCQIVRWPQCKYFINHISNTVGWNILIIVPVDLGWYGRAWSLWHILQTWKLGIKFKNTAVCFL